MNFKEAEILLDKYWACETSVEEENRLKEFFNQPDVPKHLQKYEKMFRYFKQQQESGLDNTFDNALLPKLTEESEVSKTRSINMWYKVAAAVILILTFVVINQRFLVVKEKASQLVQDTFNDPDKALEETKKALLMVSQKLNKGKEGFSKFSEFNKAERILKNENVKKI